MKWSSALSEALVTSVRADRNCAVCASAVAPAALAAPLTDERRHLQTEDHEFHDGAKSAYTCMHMAKIRVGAMQRLLSHHAEIHARKWDDVPHKERLEDT